MAALKNQLFPLADYANGTQVTPAMNVRVQDIAFYLSIRRCTTADNTIWPNASTLLDVLVELSEDAGANWRPLGGFTSSGGISPGKGPNGEAPNTGFQTNIGTGNQRRLRATITISGGPLRSEGFIELLDTL